LSAGELADRSLHDLFGEGQVQVSDRAGHHRVHAGLEASGMTRDDGGHAAGLMRVGFGVLVNVDEQRAIEHVAVTLRHRLELADEIGELFDVPAADIAHDALSLGTVGPSVGVIVVTDGGVSQPGEPGQALALREHVGRDARLPRGQRVDQQIGLQLGDARPIPHVARVFRPLKLLSVVGWQAGDAPSAPRSGTRRDAFCLPGPTVH
jgi:hypothetical protein